MKKKNNDSDEETNTQIISIKNDTYSVNKNHIYFYKEITNSSCMELNKTINELTKQLLKHSIDYDIEPPNIYLHIKSLGGCILSALSIIDTIKNSKINIISIIEGSSASAATLISIVCKKRLITSNSFMLIHQLSSGTSGKYDEMKDDFINDTNIMNKIYKLYLDHTIMDITSIKNVLKHDLWWNAEKCIKYGLADCIYNGNLLNNINLINDKNNKKRIKVKRIKVKNDDDEIKIIKKKK